MDRNLHIVSVQAQGAHDWMFKEPSPRGVYVWYPGSIACSPNTTTTEMTCFPSDTRGRGLGNPAGVEVQTSPGRHASAPQLHAVSPAAPSKRRLVEPGFRRKRGVGADFATESHHYFMHSAGPDLPFLYLFLLGFQRPCQRGDVA